MIVMSVVLLFAAGAGFGWYARRAYVRINTWGHNMNEVDEIFRFAEEGVLEDEAVSVESHRIGVIRFDESSSESTHRDVLHVR